MDNTLAYIDQGSFLALRALGRGPVIQFTWVYDHPVDVDGLRRFHANLGVGLLGRRIERSPLPFGRDRWVTAPPPDALEIASRDRARADVWAWADERVRVPVDPRLGPSWHLGVQPFTEGGAGVTLVVSHSIGDAMAINLAVLDAVRGVRRDLGYPAPGSRTRGRAMLDDGRRTVRDLPEMARAVGAAVRVARAERDGLATSVKSGSPPRRRGASRKVVAPNATAFVDLSHWDERARSLNGTSNSLFAAVGARLAGILGRVGDDGLVRLSLPVSERGPDDTRANALTEASVTVDPETVTTDLTDLRRDVKDALTALAVAPNDLLGPLALVPLTPAFLVRRLEGMVAQLGSPVGCSNLGQFTDDANRPDGTDAERFAARLIEPGVTTDVLDRMGGLLFLGCTRIGTMVSITVTSWVPGGANTHAAVRSSLRRTLDDMQVSATVE
ncbi:hypothetical protein [Mycolicibacterium sediminis]|uniref:Diacylglycerol O-acyltransferase n=1 Tax=Mycolicibacterium sediminis TaxID=1286180 RepID=A0A7I7QUW0_9MYCO|nr:hypothetical protein [Mycolicibacterium sediminis]BBY29767.1 hypothetical protein MSEDJ_38630 [Mycolicibacterium sediminis]